MIEYPDGQFSENMTLEDAFAKIKDHIEQDVEFKALHVGTPAYLDQKRIEPDLMQRLDSLEKRMMELEPEPKSKTIHIPTDEEVKRFMRKESPCKVSI